MKAPNSELLIELAGISQVFERFLERDFARIYDLALFRRRRSVEFLDRTHNLHALEHSAEDDVPAVQMWGRHRGDEKLTAVGVFAGVRHGEKSSTLVAKLEVFVLELLTV